MYVIGNNLYYRGGSRGGVQGVRTPPFFYNTKKKKIPKKKKSNKEKKKNRFLTLTQTAKP